MVMYPALQHPVCHLVGTTTLDLYILLGCQPLPKLLMTRALAPAACLDVLCLNRKCTFCDPSQTPVHLETLGVGRQQADKFVRSARAEPRAPRDETALV